MVRGHPRFHSDARRYRQTSSTTSFLPGVRSVVVRCDLLHGGHVDPWNLELVDSRVLSRHLGSGFNRQRTCLGIWHTKVARRTSGCPARTPLVCHGTPPAGLAKRCCASCFISTFWVFIMGGPSSRGSYTSSWRSKPTPDS